MSNDEALGFMELNVDPNCVAAAPAHPTQTNAKQTRAAM
jgi:hypothetical protein